MDRIDNFGRLKVDENLRIKGHRNIFVVGDIIDIKPKLFVSSGRQDAVAQFLFTSILGLVPGMIKSKDLYVGKMRKKMGLQP
ncbi:hypothetical protein H5410_047166, partial [Solanum commersonii]